MRLVRLLVLYTALALGANGAHADNWDRLEVHDTPRPVPDAILQGESATAGISDFHGKWVILTFWATWCAPCREELPGLEALQVARPDITVLTVAAGPHDPAQITRLFRQLGLRHLPQWRDPHGKFAAAMAVKTIPLTVILTPEGKEVARLPAPVDWNSAKARSVLENLRL
ncbi:thiol-disulfide isomerase/thioredoxin [Rhodovulum imhoffii]|uniref:Thiol-disulfide isomerase/thioredoxin n=1 Tax=Rhodovulum imhoffii TaxID=365340 RepID=A0A2T5BUM0_9RHOB|nr:TlpA disulfide reductase family protein [Rhodovulum imhoffii]MBK5934817.1 hypothetical protein [Rhodovulum imhoffii]PTN03219.1 thiol-disulfide isomerase/thioredoxin [Rhodovulum imhoffii]